MSKKALSIIIVGVVLVAGGYFAVKANKGTENKNRETVNTAPKQPAGKKMAFSQFVKQGGSYKCEVKQSMSDVENSGTVYFSGGNIRGEYNTIAEGRPMQTSFLLKDGYSYTWSSMSPSMGFKVKMQAAAGDTSASAQGTYSWNAEQIGDYNCEAWTADQSKFTLPAGVNFTAMGAQ